MPENKSSAFFQAVLLSFVFFLFLTLGSPKENLQGWRMIWAVFLLALSLFVLKTDFSLRTLSRFSLAAFGAFLIFQFCRSGWAFYRLHAADGALDPGTRVLLETCLKAPLKWLFYAPFYALGLVFFNRRERVWNFARVLAWGGFFLALNAVPALLIRGKMGYASPYGSGFFFPVFYFHPWIDRFILGEFSFFNQIGDIIGIGFFAGLGIIFYTFARFKDARKSESASRPAWLFLMLYLTLTLITAGGVLLVLSRGTVVCFAAAFLIFFFSALAKFPGSGHKIFIALIFGVLLGFLGWVGNFKAQWKEISTLQTESKLERGSLATNREAAGRALLIYRAHPLSGTGTDGYARFSKQYASPKGKIFKVADRYAICHYLQILAEEGAGAYLYFLFLLFYFLEMIRGLWSTQSRFKFLMAFSFFGAVLMILGHGAINYLMQHFPLALLTYLLMGAGLGVLREDFQHAEA